MASSPSLDISCFTKDKSFPSGNLEHLPCRVMYDGPALVDTYMIKDHDPTTNQFTTTFRGRLLQGATVTLPEKYSCVLISPGTQAKQQDWVCAGKFSECLKWCHDEKPADSNLMNVKRLVDMNSVLHG